MLLVVLLIPHCLWGIDWNKGRIKDKNFHVVVSFEKVNDKIIIPVSVANKTYRFLLDTGAPCSVSKNLAVILGLKAATSKVFSDQSGIIKTDALGYMNDIAIAGISFDSIPTIIEKESNLFDSCLNVDGIIGSSLLRTLIVQFSYQNQQIVLTDQLEKLGIDSKNITPLNLSEAASIPFFQFTYAPSMKHIQNKMGLYMNLWIMSIGNFALSPMLPKSHQ